MRTNKLQAQIRKECPSYEKGKSVGGRISPHGCDGNTIICRVGNFRNASSLLPARCRAEPSIITRANNASEKPYFTITLYSLSEGFTSAHAWTESQTAGVNFSNPYTEVSVGQTKNIYYSRTVDRGANVKLNLDNPVYTAAAPYASGRWTPN